MGYNHPDYARSLAEFGDPRELPRCGGWILERQIPGWPYKDSMGCYPLFTCKEWSQLNADLKDIENELVTLSLVTDSFGAFDLADLQESFDVVIPFKEHFIIDLKNSIETFVCKHHRRYARQALRSLYIERCKEPEQFVEMWEDLYANLIRRHNLKGIKAFSKIALAEQLSIPGIVMFRAVHEKEGTVGMLLWYIQQEVVYYHLGASSPAGYNLRASFALFWFAIEYFTAIGSKWLNLGGGAGTRSKYMDGLSQFKSGWSTGTKTAYFCGRIFDKEKYREIVRSKRIFDTNYFPAYRGGELA